MSRPGTHTHIDSAAAVGRRLKEARRAKCMSQRDLAFPGCTAVYICRIERGDRVPSLQVIRTLAERLDISMDWLASGQKPLRNGVIQVPEEAWDSLTGRGKIQDRFRIYRLCECDRCEGEGRVAVTHSKDRARCGECRGEGRTLQVLATTDSEQGVCVTLGTLALEGEFIDCPLGLLDTQGEVGSKWLITPWVASPRTVSDAARVLGSARKGERNDVAS